MAYQDVRVGGVQFRLSRRALSTFVGIEVASGAHAGEIFAYIVGLGTEAYEEHWFKPGFSEWPREAEQLYTNLAQLVRGFHDGQRQQEAPRVKVKWRAAAR